MSTSVFITGAGSGFGKAAALALAQEGFDVIAAVEILSQKSQFEGELRNQGITNITVEKVDVTNPDDHQVAWRHEPDVLVNNAGISEGGAVVDIPAANLRRQYEINVIGPVLLTQGFAKQMIARGAGKVVWVSSVAGITTDPFAGAYSSSKHAIEALAEAMNKELMEFGVDIQTVNPGPYLTGFNDRMFESWQTWEDDPTTRTFDYASIAFPHEQYDPQIAVTTLVDAVAGRSDAYRNVTPVNQIEPNQKEQQAVWTRKINSAAGATSRHELVEKAYQIEPGTPVETNPEK